MQLKAYTSDIEIREWYGICRGSLWKAWLLQLVYFFLIFMAAYLVKVYVPELHRKITRWKPFLTKVAVVLVSAAILVIGITTVTPERMNQFNQAMEQAEMERFVQEIDQAAEKMLRKLGLLENW